MKPTSMILTLILLCGLISSCGNVEPTESPEETSLSENAETVESVDPDNVCDLPSDVRFDGETFTFAVYENANTQNLMIVDEEDGETINDAIYQRKIKTEERLGVTIEQVIYNDNFNEFQNPILAGDNAYDVGNIRCTDALKVWQEGMIIPASELPYVNIEKNYWNKSFNESLTLCGEQYVIIGDMMISTLDLTYALLFNKQLVADYNLDSPYELVNSGAWTIDAMYDMMKQVASDVNGDTVMDDNDRYGYLSHPKQVLPNFWIAAGEMSVKKDESDVPYLAMGEERFNDVIQKVFEVLWDAETYYLPTDQLYDVPESSIKLFTNNQSLFMDSSFHHVQQLRGMETDFGILPYPKYDESQERYYSRVSYYNAPIVPVTNDNLELTGALLEYFNYISSETVIPAYYDIVLYSKVSRDDESQAMLDLIFDSRVVDIGDTTLCADIRDGFVATMFQTNDRNLASKLPTAQSKIDAFLSKMPE